MGKVNIPKRAFILAAGFGTRMRPLTDHMPKPMVEVAGRSLIWRSLDQLREAGVCEVVVNLHYLADILEEHLNLYMRDHPKMLIHISFEKDILETGGGIKNVLHYFKDEPFYVIAGDALWSDGIVPALERLARAWDAEVMDIITLMQPVERMSLTSGVGDYDMLENGLVHRSLNKMGAYMWTNIRLNAPSIYKNIEEEDFSFLKIMDSCEKEKRFYALEHDGDWHHISTPKDLETVDAYFRDQDKNGAA
ncbi:MAG: nucleotidyl transferase [Alphaproteobacteria bacterium]|nr:MAG: nucleotidyl transferase [Alphaproteobacteria bacterium]